MRRQGRLLTGDAGIDARKNDARRSEQLDAVRLRVRARPRDRQVRVASGELRETRRPVAPVRREEHRLDPRAGRHPEAERLPHSPGELDVVEGGGQSAKARAAVVMGRPSSSVVFPASVSDRHTSSPDLRRGPPVPAVVTTSNAPSQGRNPNAAPALA